jgi:nucleotide-binding universal stress UspA family protein
MKLLIGYDSSECAEAALADLARAGLPSAVEALVLAVAEVWLPPPSGYEIVGGAGAVTKPVYKQEARLLQWTETLAQEGAETLRKLFPAWRVGADSAQGSPAWALIMKADQWKPDLVVVGSRGRSAVERFVLGSVSQKVLAEARCSVRVARALAEDAPAAPRLLLGHDGSAAADLALNAIIKRTWPAGTAARVVCAQDSFEAIAGRILGPVNDWLAEAQEESRQRAENIARGAEAALRAAGLETTSVVLGGKPHRALIEEAENWGATGIFLGAIGAHNALERFLLGSVAASVAARAHCSVEVVRG